MGDYGYLQIILYERSSTNYSMAVWQGTSPADDSVQGKLMNLYLVQHGEAMPEKEDPQRPLSEKGRRDIKTTASFVSQRGHIRAHIVLHSGKTRALQTAQILAEHANPPDGVKQADGLAPLDDPSIWAGRLSEITEDLILVGHLPHLEKLASLLLCGTAEKKMVDFRMAGIVCLGRDETGNWTLQWIIIPDMLS
jgi:phosphohistidine phosphatase